MDKEHEMHNLIDWIKFKDTKYIQYGWIWEILLIIFLSIIFTFLIFSMMAKFITGEAKDIGFLVAGVIAGLVSILISFNNKENELNKYRIKWCDDIRGLAHSYIAEVTAAHNSLCLLDQKYESYHSRLLFYYDNFIEHIGFEVLRDIEEKSIKVDLLLERKGDFKAEKIVHELFEFFNDEFLSIVARIYFLGGRLKAGENVENIEADVGEIKECLDNLNDVYLIPFRVEVGVYLNDEWNKVKFGSFWFRVKRSFIISLIIALFVTAVSKIGI
ncbi:hypothetical protein HZU72_14915 [Halomonas sp. QX-2]|uniref:Uncharacterized protein n=1 Tax=Vreelandella sedimenti TaxID=2729618 RepID=A0A7Z0N930_9GAMM|nr:hypothetical protein [Halomonas sedimenti]NYT73707.1 hypothetical protein [Halomonas sedimenti]